MNPSQLYNRLFDLIDEQTVVLTPNRRLAASLHKLYQAKQLQQGETVWTTPDILPISSWQQRLWSDYLSTATEPLPFILNAAQEKFLWENVILQSNRYDSLLRTSETADKVYSAYKLLKQWRIRFSESELLEQPELRELFSSAEDYTAFLHWANLFDQDCQQKNCISPSNLPELMMERVKKSAISLPQKVILVGFTDLPPQSENFFDTCRTQGTYVEIYSVPPVETLIQCVGLANAEEEIRAMARWAKHQLQIQPTQRIACVVPSIEINRSRIQQVFAETFAEPGSLQNTSGIFNITAGKPLQAYPVINAALNFLNLYKKNLPLETFSSILFSPFIGDAEAERLKRAKLDRLLRQANISKINLAKQIEAEQKNASGLITSCPQLVKRFKQFFSMTEGLPKENTYLGWAKIFNTLLTHLGWPGERSLNSEEYQVVDSWLSLLDIFVSLDAINGSVSYHSALKILAKLCASTVFQPQTPEAQVQVMGLLEAGGLPFDQLWVSGMDDVSWPPQPQPNPFLPRRLQRELHMPHASAERELLFCKTLMQQFAECSAHIIYSYAEKNEELELQPSALLKDYVMVHENELSLAEAQIPAEKIFRQQSIEWIQDDIAPPLNADETIKGGISVLQHQALCPFRSFARWRLFAQEIESPVPGLRAKDRGIMIHKIMELIWNQLGSHEALLQLNDIDLRQLISQQVQIALTHTPSSHSEFKQYLRLERKRLENLVYDWLENEKERTPFKVMTHEKRVESTFGQLTLSFRIDRIDLLEDGNQFIVDYKTGKYNDLNDWFSERPEQPQLPLYALLESKQTVGIAFAQICAGSHGFKGVSKYAIDVKGIKLISEIRKAQALSWDQQLSNWKNVLLKLSADFSLGMAQVDPKEAEQTCQWCALKPLCRVNEEACN